MAPRSSASIGRWAATLLPIGVLNSLTLLGAELVASTDASTR